MLRADTCFREAIRDYFGDTSFKPRRSLAERILDWAFGSSEHERKPIAWCDYCDRDMLGKYGIRSYVAAVVGEVAKIKRAYGAH